MARRVVKADRGMKAVVRRQQERLSQLEYDRIQNALVEHDRVVAEYEGRWGIDRLQELVSQELREKFYQQRVKLNAAIDANDGKEVQHQVQVMLRAYAALEKAARDAGQKELTGEYWEVLMPDDRVLAVTRNNDEGWKVAKENPKLVVYSLEEIANILHARHGEMLDKIDKVKAVFNGAAVTEVRPTIEEELNDKIPF